MIESNLNKKIACSGGIVPHRSLAPNSSNLYTLQFISNIRKLLGNQEAIELLICPKSESCSDDDEQGWIVNYRIGYLLIEPRRTKAKS
jgi:hypothetical protein